MVWIVEQDATWADVPIFAGSALSTLEEATAHIERPRSTSPTTRWSVTPRLIDVEAAL